MKRLHLQQGGDQPPVRWPGQGRALQREPLGEVVDSLGVTHQPEPGEQVQGAMVLLKVVDDDGHVALRAVWSGGLSWLERVGMLREAERAETTRNLGLDG